MSAGAWCRSTGVFRLPSALFVDSGSHQFDANTPYRIAASVSYPSGAEPRVLCSHEFASSSPDSFDAEGVSGAKQFSDENGVYTPDGARVSLQLTKPGTTDKPTSAEFVLLPDPPDPGPTVDDFTLTIDSRMLVEADAGYSVLFRLADNSDDYQVEAKIRSRQVRLGKMIEGVLVPLTEWQTVPGPRPLAVNRTVVRCAGKDLLVNINGQDVAQSRMTHTVEGWSATGRRPGAAQPRSTLTTSW